MLCLLLKDFKFFSLFKKDMSGCMKSHTTLHGRGSAHETQGIREMTDLFTSAGMLLIISPTEPWSCLCAEI